MAGLTALEWVVLVLRSAPFLAAICAAVAWQWFKLVPRLEAVRRTLVDFLVPALVLDLLLVEPWRALALAWYQLLNPSYPDGVLGARCGVYLMFAILTLVLSRRAFAWLVRDSSALGRAYGDGNRHRLASAGLTALGILYVLETAAYAWWWYVN